MRDPLHLKTLVPDEVRAALERDPRLLVPVGPCAQHGPALPLGCHPIPRSRLWFAVAALPRGSRHAPPLLSLAPPAVRRDRAQDFVLPARQRQRCRRGARVALPPAGPGSVGRPSIASREKGERLYKMIYERVATRVLAGAAA